jgi:hypothetical protein
MKTFTRRISATVPIVIALAFSVTGCSSLHEVVTATSIPGYRHYDPCIRCGESWIIVPNQPMAALHQSKDKPGFTKSDYEAGLREMYGPNWREVQRRAQSPR